MTVVGVALGCATAVAAFVRDLAYVLPLGLSLLLLHLEQKVTASSSPTQLPSSPSASWHFGELERDRQLSRGVTK